MLRPLTALTLIFTCCGYDSCSDYFTRPFIFGGNLPPALNSGSSSGSDSGGGSAPADDDNDGLSNEVESSFGLETRRSDTDFDGFDDGLEFVGRNGDPLNARISPISFARDRIVVGDPVPDSDRDGDGIGDRAERELGLDPSSPDTDEDGYSDGLELVGGSSPTSSSSRPVRSTPPSSDGLPRTGNPPTDRDGDGLSDDLETQLTTQPGQRDSDLDGFSDGIEYLMGSDLTSQQSVPNFSTVGTSTAASQSDLG